MPKLHQLDIETKPRLAKDLFNMPHMLLPLHGQSRNEASLDTEFGHDFKAHILRLNVVQFFLFTARRLGMPKPCAKNNAK